MPRYGLYDHKEKICWGINQAINEKIGDSDISIEGIFRWGGKMVLKKGAKFFIDQSISVKDYFVLSIGYYTFNDHNDIISLGMFNHIFTYDKNDILEELEKNGF